VAKVYAGTSGFAYPSWKPDFYPAKLPAAKFLEHYSSRLNSTEVNYTFRQLPKAETLSKWVDATPDDFTFTLKAHMRLTHILRLQNASEFLGVFLRAVDPLRTIRRLGPILFQLPPQLQSDPDRLRNFVRELPSDVRFAFEFRHPSWLCDPIYTLLSEHGICLCLAESDKLVIPEVRTAPFVYFRLRRSDYTPEDRAEIAERVRELLAAGTDAYVYFKHEDTPAGALYAEELLQAVRS
jgi:uncharacterized protein YecE (DUF72 family)